MGSTSLARQGGSMSEDWRGALWSFFWKLYWIFWYINVYMEDGGWETGYFFLIAFGEGLRANAWLASDNFSWGL
jgi:hypothetical protein